MLRCCTVAGTDLGANDNRCLSLAAEHVTELGGLIEDLVEADAHEIDEHELGNRPQAARRGADRGRRPSTVTVPVLSDRGFHYDGRRARSRAGRRRSEERRVLWFGLSLAALGLLPPMLAAAAQSLPDLGILANSPRLLRQR